MFTANRLLCFLAGCLVPATEIVTQWALFVATLTLFLIWRPQSSTLSFCVRLMSRSQPTSLVCCCCWRPSQGDDVLRIWRFRIYMYIKTLRQCSHPPRMLIPAVNLFDHRCRLLEMTTGSGFPLHSPPLLPYPSSTVLPALPLPFQSFLISLSLLHCPPLKMVKCVLAYNLHICCWRLDFGPRNGSPTLLFLLRLLSDFQSTKAFSFHNRSSLTSHIDWRQYSPQSHRVGFLSWALSN